jgi:Protein of unknown function DUF262
LEDPLAAKPHLPNELVGVLDGQQRLNSMYVALQGTYAYKRPRVWTANPNAYPVRQFYINVFKPEVEGEDDDCVYEFSFLVSEKASEITPVNCWCLVRDLLACKGVPEVIKYWATRKKLIPQHVAVPETTDENAINILGKLWERLTTIPIVNYYPVKKQNLDEVLDIFVRVNSGGTPLAKTDLLFSTIVAEWENGREAIEEFLEKLNQKGSGFCFDMDFMMRVCLVLAKCPIRLRVASFKSENVKLIVKDWKSITTAVDRAVDLLVEWGFQGATLPSTNAIIPVAYAIKSGFDIGASKTDLRLLLIKSLLTGVYGGSGDQVLSSVRKAMDEMVKTDGVFQLKKFEAIIGLPGGKSITISEDTLDDLLVSVRGARSFALLSLLSSHLKFNQVQFHQDHIHSYAGFDIGALRKLNLNTEQISDWQAKRDTLPNLHLSTCSKAERIKASSQHLSPSGSKRNAKVTPIEKATSAAIRFRTPHSSWSTSPISSKSEWLCLKRNSLSYSTFR